MADFNIRAILSVVDKNFSSTLGDAATLTGKLNSSMGSTIKTGVLMGAGMKAISVATNAVTSSMGAAISRVDTLKQFPKVMKQMGFGAKESTKAINDLSKGIEGLPTSLDEIAANAQSIALLTGDLDSATKTAIALNNAFLSGGSSSADAARGLTQYTQMLSAGKVDMQSWRTLLETMGPALNKVANAFGFAGASAKNDLYNALQSGKITFDELNKKIIELNEGTGGFAELAKTSSAGIATSFTNIKTAITKGIAGSISVIDNGLKFIKGPSGLTGIAGIADIFKSKINSIFGSIGSFDAATGKVSGALSKIDFKGMIEAATPYWNTFASVLTGIGKTIVRLTSFLGEHAKAVTAVAIPVAGLVMAYNGLNSVPGKIARISSSFTAFQANASASLTAVKPGIDKLKTGLTSLKSAWSSASAIVATESARMSTVNSLYGKGASSIYQYSASTSKATGITKAFTVVQRGLNLVMKANPILLVIGLIAGLVVALGALEAAGKDVTGAINNFSKSITTKINTLSEQLPGIIEGFVNSLVENMPSIIQAGVNLLQAIADGIVKAMPVLIAAAPKIMVALIKGIIAVIGALLKAGWRIIKALIKGIVKALPSLKTAAITLAKNIPKWIKNAITGLAGIGKNIVTGLWNGIKNKVAWLKGKIKDFVGNVKTWLKKFFKIGSPSRLMAKEIGKYIPMGIAVGIDKNAGTVMDSVQEIANRVASITAPALDFAAAGYSGSFDANYDYSRNNSFTIEVPLTIDGKEFARTTASYTEAELNTRTARNNRKRGII